MRIVKGDMVVVTCGDDKSNSPRKVLRVVDADHVVIEQVNRVYRHVKKGHPKSPQGGRLSIELPIDSSNVLPFCSKCGRGVKVANKIDESGKKHRSCRKCGSLLVPSGKK